MPPRKEGGGMARHRRQWRVVAEAPDREAFLAEVVPRLKVMVGLEVKAEEDDRASESEAA